ncbi:unnamed protein product [Danaus chrysippus]|uniref:(African queen) hypothetical protein n=1 Tax=Danaus chrysippus TaxID=151541 RepID=A0A8J2QGA4_9NEOP|nr:unnamed protein product [Danaus chrysippus]
MSSPTHSNDAQDISFTSLTDGSPVNCVTTRRTRVDTEGGLNPLLKELREFKESMVNKMDKWFARQENMISKVVKEFNEVKQTMNQMSNYFDELNNKTTACLNRLAETEKKVKSLEEHTKTITQLEAKIESMEQHSRQCNVEIQNVPERRNENLIKIVEHIGTSIKQSISPNDIVSVHRVPHADTKSTHPKSIVVKLCSRILRDNILSAARMKKGLYTDDLHINGENRRVYVNEHLTLRNKQLFRSARETAKRCNFRFTWIKHGREEGGGVLVAVRRELRPVRRALPGPVPPIVDSIASLLRYRARPEVLLDEVDKFCEWTDGLRTKPSKCHCLCLGRRNTRYTSYDPGLSLGGQCISTVTENAPFKFLGRKIDNIGRTPSLEGIVDSFLNDLNKLDAGVIKMLKLWLGLALTADSSALFRGSNSFGMSLKRPSELYKHLRVSKRYILGKSHDDIVTSLPKDEDAPEMINIRSMQ